MKRAPKKKAEATRTKKAETPDPLATKRLIVGLRNPGAGYAATRHNIGGEIVAVLADRAGTGFKRARQSTRAEIAEVRIGDSPVVLALPTAFMNESGQTVAPLLRYFSVTPEHLLVVHDDIDLPFLKLRVQFGRGAGGHNGVHSVIGSLGTRDFWRLKVGVGRPPGSQVPADYVLRRFSKQERPEVDVAVQHAADLAEAFVTEGGEAASQRAGELGVVE